MANQDEKVAAVTKDLEKLETDDKKKEDVKKVSEEKAGMENEKSGNEQGDEDEEKENEEEKENINTCNFCKKDGPTKRCSKRHPKCIKKLFCNTTCEEQAHKKKTPAGGVKKTEVKKKKKYTYKEPCQWAL
eukprot:TRINITY_DN3073_c0_g1_i1.p1 TRINITY_DN3073_c0_g1~~TRINITY_DN3073_c0_g1_i1.p1  ORF type:complete len:131 (+),score=70.68 TRINITY_DN3073_c0_g1_i1:67-459(+)